MFGDAYTKSPQDRWPPLSVQPAHPWLSQAAPDIQAALAPGSGAYGLPFSGSVAWVLMHVYLCTDTTL
jgi:hypothetical protein